MDFDYEGLRSDGQNVKGKITSSDASNAIQALRIEGIFPVKITAVGEKEVEYPDVVLRLPSFHWKAFTLGVVVGALVGHVVFAILM